MNDNGSYQVRDAEAAPATAPLSGRRSPSSAPLSLNVTPMIDVVFLLLIYFIISFDFKPQEESLSIDAPYGTQGASARTLDPFELPKRPIEILVRSHGDDAAAFSLSSDDPSLGPLIGVEDLYQKLREARTETITSDQAFTIRALADARWEHTLATFNALRRAGFQHVRFVTPADPVRGAGS